MDWIIANWQLIVGALVVSGALDAAAGLIPDRYIPYVGIVRRFITALRDRKNLQRAVFCLVCALAAGGCAILDATGGPEGVCAGPTVYVDRAGAVQTMDDPMQTTLCRLDPYPSTSKLTLFVVNDVALRKGAYTPEDVFVFTAKVRGYLSVPAATTKTVSMAVLADIQEVPELVIAGSMLEDPKYQLDLPIDDFTWYFLNKHLNEQDALARMFMD